MITHLRSVICSFLILFSTVLVAQETFINELHYDNAGADAGEAIEIAGAAGTDLAGWRSVLYNGSNGTVYDTIDLTGMLPDQANGYGALSFILPSNGLQNGSPDGIALVDAAGTVIQFLSYEGTLTAVGGLADGATSMDIGVEETNSTPVGASISLIGNGTFYADFSWQVTETNSFGNINADQSFGSAVSAPVINEFVFNHTGFDTDEFVEVFSKSNEDLSAFSLLVIEGDNNALGTVDYVLQLGVTDTLGYFTAPFAANAFENGTQTLLLVSDFTGAQGDDLDTNDDGLFDATPWSAIIDAVAVNDGGAGDLTYTEVVLPSDFDGGSFTVGGASRFPNVMDTNTPSDWVRNSFNGAGLPSFPAAVAEDGEALNTPNAENQVFTAPVVAQLLINELDADTEGTDTLEFVELYDGGVGNTLLDGYVLVFYNGSNDTSYATYDLSGSTTDANGYLVLGNVDVPNVSMVFEPNGLQNGADAVALYKGLAVDFPNGSTVTTDNLVDAVVYDTDDNDDEGLLVLLAEGQPQVNENVLGNKDFQSLQRFPNGSGNGRETASFVTAIPTPGAANTNATEAVTLLINELDSDTAGSDSQEFVELFDGGRGNTPLDGFVLVAFNGNGDLSYNAFDLDGYTTNAEGYFVIGNVDVLNVDLVVSNNSFQNGADAIALYRGEAVSFPNGTSITLDGLVDALVYGTGDDTDPELIALLNPGELQADEDVNGSKDSESLQRIPNGAGGARNTSSYVAQTPTPGTANDAIITPGQVLSIAAARNAAEGETVTLTGILTVSDQFNGPAFIQDATGGIAIFDDTVHGPGVFAIGDSITVTGTRTAFNGLEQISPVNVVAKNAVPTGIISPKTITLAELSQYPGQLVRIENVGFPNPGDLLFGNSNFTLTDASGSGEMRIDIDAVQLIGLAQPESCEYIIGVVGRFNDTFQLLPRLASDIPCAQPYIDPTAVSPIPKSDTFDVVAWNIEWFGDENNGPAAGNPMSDPIQRDSVLTVLKRLDADVIAVEEVSDDALFADLVSRLPGYDYVLSDAFSIPDGAPPHQKLGFIYRTSVVSPVRTQVLLKTIAPLYNGGDDSTLVNYPSTTDRFYASGRLPFLMTADVTINGTTEQIDLIALHARANSGTESQNRYDMRKYDVEVLKDSLDVQFKDRKVILMGDYNDDVDETVADGVNTKISSFVKYVDDAANYTAVTGVLSAQGRRSFVSRENMIDHVIITNELYDSYLDGSATVHYEFYDRDYTRTASDHFPVSARFVLTQKLVLDSTEVVNVTCNGADDGLAMVFVSGGSKPLTYTWSDGQTEATAFDLKPGTYSVNVGDASGQELMINDIVITQPEPITFSVPEKQIIYKGYEYEACQTLSVKDIVAAGSYEVTWSTGETGGQIRVCPEETTTYTATVTDANGCATSKEVVVEVQDVSCGNNRWFPTVQVCYKGRSLCVDRFTAYFLLRYGGKLGSCTDNGGIVITKLVIYPNPVRDQANIYVTTSTAALISFDIYDFYGNKVVSQQRQVSTGSTPISLDVALLRRGVYVLKPSVNAVIQDSKILIKR